jgi:hypothetical protein
MAAVGWVTVSLLRSMRLKVQLPHFSDGFYAAIQFRSG